MAFLVWLDATFDCTTAERDHNAIRPQTDEKMTSEVHPHWDAEQFLACRQTFVANVGELHKKGGFGSSHGRSTAGSENRPTVREKRGRWSRKAGGRYSQCSFWMKSSVHEKAVVGSRWSLFAVVAEARFYCTTLISISNFLPPGLQAIRSSLLLFNFLVIPKAWN